MKLLTADIRKSMPGPRTQEDNPDPMVYAKFFDPTSQWTWFAYEAWGEVFIDDHYAEVPLSALTPKTDGGPGEHFVYETYDVEDITFFGLVYGAYTEFGIFSLNELKSIKGRFGLGIERETGFEPKPLSQVKEEMRRRGYGDF